MEIPSSDSLASRFHHYKRPELNTFVIDFSQSTERGGSHVLVSGYYTSAELAREYEAALLELEDAEKRLKIPYGHNSELAAFRRVEEVLAKISADRALTLRPGEIGDMDELTIPVDWAVENLDLEESGSGRIKRGQVLTPKRLGDLALAGGFTWGAPEGRADISWM